MTLALINQEVKIIMTSLAEAVVYMHNKGIHSHCDIIFSHYDIRHGTQGFEIREYTIIK
jgi:hypothetical protein